MLTCPYNVDPLTPHFYIVKLGFTGVYIFSYFCSKTYIVGARYNRLNEVVLTCTHYLCFGRKKEIFTIFHLKIMIFTGVKNRRFVRELIIRFTICSFCILTYCNFSYLPLWF